MSTHLMSRHPEAREHFPIYFKDDGQFACPEATDEEEGSCDMPECPYTDWGEWTKCTGEFCGAGQVGLRSRTRECIPAVRMNDIPPYTN